MVREPLTRTDTMENKATSLLAPVLFVFASQRLNRAVVT